MRIYLHIGLEQCGADRVQKYLDRKRERLINKDVLFSKSLGKRNHTRLYMAVSDPNNPDMLRHQRGFGDPASQERLMEAVVRDIAAEVAEHKPKTLILSCYQLCTLSRPSELIRLRALLSTLSKDIRIVAHIDEQGRALTDIYAQQIMSGRTTSLDQELALSNSKNWREDCLATWATPVPELGDFPEIQRAPFWLDYKSLYENWRGVFGKDSFSFWPFDTEHFASPKVQADIHKAFDLPDGIGDLKGLGSGKSISAAWLTRARLMNIDLVKLLATGRVIPRNLWRRFLRDLEVNGPTTDAASLAAVSKMFEADNLALIQAHPALQTTSLQRATSKKSWQEAPPEKGFRTSQYIAAFLPAINKETAEEKPGFVETSPSLFRTKRALTPPSKPDFPPEKRTQSNGLTADAKRLFTPVAQANFDKLLGGRFEPHNRLSQIKERELDAPYTEINKRSLPKGNTGNVIVGCMKNEGPFIIEWVAYHRAMGIDNFIIYTNGCEDGTTEILDRLQEMGVLFHRNNDNWKGNSPQQYALNQSLKEDVIKNAKWIAHIDVDEFINVRVGNGTMDDLFDRIKGATNVAMTWRLFGHNGVTKINDDLVIDQFDGCAPQYCPKPHTVWGFKTLFKNVGAYEKISCHRPTKLIDKKRKNVSWVNGSGQPIKGDIKDNGWRSSVKSIGYDVVQLNHYALRSAESFLIKRQRGRALHVDRSIGINYWVRMDWSENTDLTIKRNSDRTKAEIARLMQDNILKKLHNKSMAWHLAKVDDLHQLDEFKDLYKQAVNLKLTEVERIAYAMSLDMES